MHRSSVEIACRAPAGFGLLCAQDATRRRTLREIAAGERAVAQLAAPIAISLAAASKHVEALERARSIRRAVQGRTLFRRLDARPLAAAQRWRHFHKRFWIESDLRRQWLAAGQMTLAVGAAFELVWRNDELAGPPGRRAPGAGGEHRMQCRITELEPPRRLSFTWAGSGDVTFDLAPEGRPSGSAVRLTVTHRRLPDRNTMLSVGAGWHSHLDILVARATGEQPEPFWDSRSRLKEECHRRLPA